MNWHSFPMLMCSLLVGLCSSADPNEVHTSILAQISHYARNGTLDSDYCATAANPGLCQSVQACFNISNPDDPFFAMCQLVAAKNAKVTNESGTVSAKRRKSPPSSASVWGYGFLCVTTLLTVLIGLAVGSLSGSAVFHLIPSAFSLSEVTFFPHHSYLNISLVIFGGIYMFFIIERILKMIMEYKSRKDGYRCHSHKHDVQELRVNGGTNSTLETDQEDTMPHGESMEPILRKSSQVVVIESTYEPAVSREGEILEPTVCNNLRSTNRELYNDSQQAIRASFGHMDRPASNNRPTVGDVKSLQQKTPIATVAWMIIFGDGVHNFIDGLSIGAAFSESILTGMSVSLAVLCEEFPHELGDFAVLLNSGMTIKQALCYNFLSACTCYVGLIIGISLGELHVGNEYIFGLAGGMFLYIALVDMVPEMNETADKQTEVSLSRGSVPRFFLQNVGMLTGILSLFFLAKYQDDMYVDW
ncbi:hypothetical protein TCAL_13876 [Tigriopus californicus]|uniref:Zinc transporter ZIP14 n=1 Tax=Tigriopus californicus TaxID=6832 RepID=A0A553PDL7_TIGCA|nr:hypothetical protein TCAL_13876 [Tigriopus californicus]